MPSTPSQPRHKRFSIRWQARLDPDTYAKLHELAQRLHRKQAQILRHVMMWALDHPHTWSPDHQRPDSTRLVHMLIDPELCQRVQDVAGGQSVSVAAWVRQAMRHMTREDFPASGRAGGLSRRSHESGRNRRCLLGRLENKTWHRLETLARVFACPAAGGIRQLTGQASFEDLPGSRSLARGARGKEDPHDDIPG